MTRYGTRLARAPIFVVVVLALIATACGASTSAVEQAIGADAEATVQAATSGDAAESPEPTATPEPTPAPEPTAAPAAAEPTAEPESAAPEPAAAEFANPFWAELQAGDCIIRAEGNPAFVAPNIVSCDELHEEEVYAMSTLDAGPDVAYPGDDELVEIVAAELCDDATVDFAGEPWDALAMTTWVLYPLEEEWEAGDRTIGCSASAFNEGSFKIGTAAGGTLDTDDAFIVRNTLLSDGETWEDWMVITERTSLDTAGSLTDGQFDMAPRRPFAVDRGFVFNAHPIGSDPSETVTWGYSWETGEFTDLGSVLPGEFITGTMIANNHIVFASRETDDDDRDLWITEDSQARVLAGGDGDQHFASFTPDFEQVVYQDNGDLWIINTDGTNARQLTFGPGSVFESAVSPDGSTIVFASDRSGDDELWSINIEGGEPVNLTNHPGNDSWPVFSADGRFIYFSTDRIDPEDDQLRMMVMEADGSNQSWFSVMAASQAMLLNPSVADQVIAAAPTLNERFNFDLIVGEPGELQLYEHTSGRLAVSLPPGWRVGEYNETTGLVAGPRPDRYFDVWEIDGIDISLFDGETPDDFFARYDTTVAVESCEQIDGNGEIQSFDDGVQLLFGEFSCGDGATAAVFAFYDTDDSVGLLIEAQRDNQPNIDTDTDLLTAIVQSVSWQ